MYEDPVSSLTSAIEDDSTSSFTLRRFTTITVYFIPLTFLRGFAFYKAVSVYYEFWFSIISFSSINDTEISAIGNFSIYPIFAILSAKRSQFSLNFVNLIEIF